MQWRRENGVAVREALSGPGPKDRGGAREAGRAGGRPACVWFLFNHWLACVVQAGLGLGGCGALECESGLGAQPVSRGRRSSTLVVEHSW